MLRYLKRKESDMMGRKITIWKDPYDSGFDISSRRNVEINEGVTVLIGCNGLGKSTMLKIIEEMLKKDKIDFLSYDNLKDGGSSNNMSEALSNNNIELIASLVSSSEGENISTNLGNKLIYHVKRYMRTGKNNTKKNRFSNIFSKDEEEKTITNERWILLDAVDSGYSIDNIITLKNLFKLMLEDAEKQNVKLYIVVSANSYELANGMPCFDLAKGKYVEVNSYDEYKKIILNSRDYKDNKRYKKYENK